MYGGDKMDVNTLHNELIAQRTVETLKRNGFEALYFNSKEEASDYILNFVKAGDKVGFGGSMTIKAMEMQNKIKEKGAVILDHGDPNLNVDEKLEVMRAQLTSDLFLCSTNAVTIDEGLLINIDGSGNRVAAMTFGPKKVIVVVGINKLCKNEDQAFERLKQIACPKNNIRLNMPNPCTKTGICMDCKSESRICRIYSVFKRRPMKNDMTVLIVGETLGY